MQDRLTRWIDRLVPFIFGIKRLAETKARLIDYMFRNPLGLALPQVSTLSNLLRRQLTKIAQKNNSDNLRTLVFILTLNHIKPSTDHSGCTRGKKTQNPKVFRNFFPIVHHFLRMETIKRAQC